MATRTVQQLLEPPVEGILTLVQLVAVLKATSLLVSETFELRYLMPYPRPTLLTTALLLLVGVLPVMEPLTVVVDDATELERMESVTLDISRLARKRGECGISRDFSMAR